MKKNCNEYPYNLVNNKLIRGGGALGNNHFNIKRESIEK